MTKARSETRPPRWSPCIRITACGRDAYEPFARFHYLAGPPATISRVLVITVDSEDAGVLVTSRPVLNAAWRARAWPDLFPAPNHRANAQRINRLLRTISRVVIDPRFRGLGLAAKLVRHYLKDPETELTEAVAAMGRVSPFFERGGMTRVDREPIQPRAAARSRPGQRRCRRTQDADDSAAPKSRDRRRRPLGKIGP